MTRNRDLAILFLRLATAFNFLSAVASRFGLWSNGSNWKTFLIYAGKVNSFAPASLVPFLSVTATCLELLFGVLLLFGLFTRWAALGASILTLLFALAMSYSFGIKEAFDYSVFVDCTSAFLLASMTRYRWSVDQILLKKPDRIGEHETKNRFQNCRA